MWYPWLFVLSSLTALLLANSVTAAVHWDEMWVKHTWNDTPANWESLGNPDAGEMVDLHIALISEQERALTDALSEISNPRHPRHIHFATPLLTPIFTFAGPFQIWRISYKGTSCRACQAAPRNCRSRPCLACTPQHTTLLHLTYTWRVLAHCHGRAGVPSKPTARRIISTLPELVDERHDNRYGRVRAPRGATRSHSNCRTDDILPIYAGNTTETTRAPLRRTTSTGASSFGGRRDGAAGTRHHAICPALAIWYDRI